MNNIVLAIALVALVLNQPQSSLQGKELPLTNDLGSGLESFVSSLLGGASGIKLDRVVVVEEGPGHVTIAVTHAGLAGARVAGHVRGTDRRPVRAIAPARVDIDAPSGEAQLTFTLRPDMAGTSPTESADLRLTISIPNKPIPTTLTYRLPKLWQAGSGGGFTGGVTKISPRPVGTAAKLGARPDYENPPVPPVRPRPGRVVTGSAAAQPRGRTMPMVMRAPVLGAATAQPAAQPAPQQKPPQVNKTVLAKTANVQATLPAASRKVLAVGAFKYGIRDEDKKKGAQGPGEAAIDLLEDLAFDDVGLSGDEVLSLSAIVFQDQNPQSGIFYYVPRSYRTEWTPETGYGLRMLYGASKGAEAGDVAIAARLEAGIDLTEHKLAGDLLSAYVRRHPGTTFTALRPLPIDAVDVSLASGLQQYSIPPEKIATVALSDVLGQIEISCVTDAITKESLQLALTEDVGLSGAVKFTPSGGKLAPQQIPLRVRLADSDTFGTLTWRRDEPLHNRSPYPLALAYVHALIINPRTNLPLVYSWELGQAEIAPGGRVEWDASRIPAWVDRDAKRIWVQYRPVGKCRPCDDRVIAEVTGGVVSVTTAQLVFRTITPLADTNAYELTVHVRSRYFDTHGQQSQQKSVVLGTDGEDFPVGPFYLGEQSSQPPSGFAEYSIDVAMKDGSVHKGKRWLRADGLRVLIGTTQIRESLGFIPSEPQGGGQ